LAENPGWFEKQNCFLLSGTSYKLFYGKNKLKQTKNKQKINKLSGELKPMLKSETVAETKEQAVPCVTGRQFCWQLAAPGRQIQNVGFVARFFFFRIMGEIRRFDSIATITKGVSVSTRRERPKNGCKITKQRAKPAITRRSGFLKLLPAADGVMEAANDRGAFERRKKVNQSTAAIELPFRQSPNHQTAFFDVQVFFVRKHCQCCSAYIIFSGGYGTVDELLRLWR